MADIKKYDPVDPSSEEQSTFALKDVNKPIRHTNTVGTINTDASKRASVMNNENSKNLNDSTTTESNSATLAELYQFAEPVDYVLMFIGFWAAVGSGFCQPAFCLLFGTALDDLNSAGDLQTKINSLCVYLVILGIGNLVTATVQTGCWGYTGERQAQKWREHYTRAVLRQEIGWFDSVGANQLATKLADLTGQLRDGMTYKTADFIQYSSQVIGAVVVGLALDPYVALIMIACTPLIGGTATVWIGTIADATKGSAELYAKAGGLATESLTNIRTVTALNAQPDVISNYRKFLLNVMEIGINKGLRVGMATGLLWFVVLCTYAITLWYGSIQIADTLEFGYTDYPRAQTGGKVYAAFFACLMGAFGIGQIAPPVAAFTSARVAAKSFLEIIHREPLIDGLSLEGEKPEQRPVGEVELNDVVFAYPSRPEISVCKGYNLKIRPGESCALVGASGSGKSTVINLLLRFYDPNSGAVRLDGRDIKGLNTRWLRAQIGYVGQEPVLFSGSIADNIAYGLDATFAPELAVIDSTNASPSEIERAKQILRERVIEAATQANAHAFIAALPQGYETDVGGSGASMSGGQKQRIAIARALIKKPAVLLLDEATSALDAVSEKIVQESIDKLQKSKTQTTIIIAHRLSTIRNADKIAVVSKGVIAEEGTHDALIEMDGIYADLVRLQMEAQQDGEDPTQGNSKLASINTLLRNEVEEVKSGEKNDVPVVEEPTESGVITVVKKLSEVVIEAATGHHTTPQDVAEALRAEKDPEFARQLEEQQKENKKLLSRIWAMIYHHGGYFAVAVLGAVMVGAMFPLWGYIVGKSLGVLFLNDPAALRENAAKQAGYFVGLAGDAGIGAVLQLWGIFSVGERIVMKLRSDQFQAILRREIGYFDKSENAVGEITRRLSDDARSVAKATGQTTAAQIQALGCLGIGLILGFVSCWKIGLVVLGALVPMVVSGAVKMMAYAGQLDALLFKADTSEEKSEHGIISTAFTQMRTVSAFSVQFRVAQVYNDITQEQTVIQKKKAWVVGIAKGSAELTTNWVFAMLFFYAGVLISSGEFQFTEVMEAILSLMFASFGLGQALADLGDTKEALDAARRIFDTIEAGESSAIDGLSLTGTKPTTRATGRIELSGVNFSYPTRLEAQVCRDYNLIIEPGEVVALVGPSGSGKSTIMNLLLRFYDPSSGDVKIDGISTKDLNVRWLRSQIGYVGQEPVLFRGSIADNIARGRATYGDMPVLSLDEVMAAHLKASRDARIAAQKVKNTSEDQVTPAEGDVELGLLQSDVDVDVIDAAKASYAHDFIMSFSDQYKTDVGESSMMVSGGQKQRIAIARAIIKKPAVLLLDEATSALDATSERYVQESIDALQASKNQTTIVIAHRLTTIRNADKIAVINDGRVVEIGKHDELLALNGLYAELWTKQVGINPSSSSQSLSGVSK